MKIGTIDDLRLALGTRADGSPVVGRLFATALKKAAGLQSRLFDVTVAVNYLREHPNFQIRDVYPRADEANGRRPRSRPDPLVGVADKQSEPLLTHA